MLSNAEGPLCTDCSEFLFKKYSLLYTKGSFTDEFVCH